MRDPQRIKKILDQLKVLWMCYPDMRFGQMVEILTYNKKEDLFDIEDDVLEGLIQDALKGGF
jgi:hypothetical protein